MYVTPATDGDGIAETSGRRIDGRCNPPLRRLRDTCVFTRERLSHEDRPAPGAKILRRKVLAGGVPQILIYIARANALSLAGLIDVLKQIVPGELAAGLDDARQAGV